MVAVLLTVTLVAATLTAIFSVAVSPLAKESEPHFTSPAAPARSSAR